MLSITLSAVSLLMVIASIYIIIMSKKRYKHSHKYHYKLNVKYTLFMFLMNVIDLIIYCKIGNETGVKISSVCCIAFMIMSITWICLIANNRQ